MTTGPRPNGRGLLHAAPRRCQALGRFFLLRRIKSWILPKKFGGNSLCKPSGAGIPPYNLAQDCGSLCGSCGNPAIQGVSKIWDAGCRRLSVFSILVLLPKMIMQEKKQAHFGILFRNGPRTVRDRASRGRRGEKGVRDARMGPGVSGEGRSPRRRWTGSRRWKNIAPGCPPPAPPDCRRHRPPPPPGTGRSGGRRRGRSTQTGRWW